MNCHDVDRWLDDGSPEAERAAITLHARICARCVAALAAADALESALDATPSAPAGFSDRVMARVAETSQARVRIPVMEVLPLLRTFPWWVRLALEPAALLAALLASVLVWRGDALFALATTGAAWVAAWLAEAPQLLAAWAPAGAPSGGTDPYGALLVQPTLAACVALGAAPLVFMASRLLYGWSASLMGPRSLHLRVR